MNKKIERYWLVGLLVVIAITMGITKIRYRNVDWEVASNLITPTVIPTSGPEINEEYPLWELLPYSGKDFVIDRYTEPGVLAVKTKIVDKEIITQEIYNWMMENKVATESHKLIFEKTL
ncbi:MAG: hypothetical protein WC503_05250 [Candidatus Shapirobacteria bacterium]